MGDALDSLRHRAALFGHDAAGYDAGRPGYPDRVYELLGSRCSLGPGCRVVEIGPGTGQATGRLLAAGASVTAVELSENLARHLRSAHASADLTVVVGAFEDVELEPASVDLVTSATAFHWVPPDRRAALCVDLLRDGGWLSVWWHVFGDKNRPDPFHDALTELLQAQAPELLEVPGAARARTVLAPHALDAEARMGEIRADGRFGDVHHETIEWTGRQSAAELRALFGSFSPWLALAGAKREAVLDAVERLAREEFGGLVERPYLTPIYMAQKEI